MTFSELLIREIEALHERLNAPLVLYVTLLLLVVFAARRVLLAGTRVVWRLGWDQARRLARFRSIADITLLAVMSLLVFRKLASAAPVITGLFIALCAFVIAIALPTWIQDLTAGISLATRARFREGDQVRLPSAAGAVRHIGLWRTAIRAGDGGTLSVPNREMLAHTVQVGREQRAAPVEVLLPADLAATPQAREHFLRLAHLSAFRRGGSRPSLSETERGWVLSLQTWSTRDIDGARRALERQLLGERDEKTS